jgi:hypothetical protein
MICSDNGDVGRLSREEQEEEKKKKVCHNRTNVKSQYLDGGLGR